MQGRGVGLDAGVEGEITAGEHHGHAVVTDGPRRDHDIARRHPGGGELTSRGDHPDAGRRDVHPVGGAPVDDFGVARHDRDVGGPGRLRHVGDDGAERLDGDALLEHERGREGDRSSSHDGEIVDRPVDGRRSRRGSATV
jgi:hypothetical protein